MKTISVLLYVQDFPHLFFLSDVQSYEKFHFESNLYDKMAERNVLGKAVNIR